MDIAYTIAGFSVGAIVGLTGVGGGSLMTPLLVLLFFLVSVVSAKFQSSLRSIFKSFGV